MGNVQRVLLLGGTSEIGQAIVRALLQGRSGVHVVLASRNPDSCGAFASDLRGRGASVECLAFDADDPGSHRGVVDLAAAGGDLDVIITAWGVLGAPQSALDADPVSASAVVQTNFAGVVSAGLEAARKIIFVQIVERQRCFGKQARDRQHTDALAGLGVLAQRNGIGHHQFIQL